VLDLGSGAGFPGIPIAIANPSIQVILIESRRKRANFLKELIRTLNLRNSSAHEGRAEKFAEVEEWKMRFDITTTTWNIATFLNLANPFLRQNGTAIAMKGPKLQGELIKLERSNEHHGFSAPYITSYSLRENEKRAIAIFTKIGPTENVSRKTQQ
jgi:16S rRNA (guanine527-N7)-methyltransferase